MIAIVAIATTLAAPPCRDDLAKAARALPSPAPDVARLPALGRGVPDRRLGCGQTCRPSGGWKVVPVKPSAVVATSELDTGPSRADRVVDGDRDTAWAEGARGPGRGHGLVFVFDEPVMVDLVEIVPGHARSETQFVGNHRLAEGWLSFHAWPDASVRPAPAPPRFVRRPDVEPPCALDVEAIDAVVIIGDPSDPEPLRWDLSPHFCRNPGAGKIRQIVLRIGEVVEGKRYDHTALSEVRFARLEPILGSKGWVCN